MVLTALSETFSSTFTGSQKVATMPTPPSPAGISISMSSSTTTGINRSFSSNPVSSVGGTPPRGTNSGCIGNSLECDYDINPTFLYQAVEAKQWKHVLKCFDDLPSDARAQAATWVVRKERNGKLRWRLLPIHAAIIFNSPIEVVETLLQEYPIGAQQKDDQGMLPLHLAFRSEANWDVLEELLTAYPQAISVKDRKGRVPIQCSSFSTSNNDDVTKAFSVLELYTQISISAERQKSVTESRQAIESRTTALQDTHVQTLTNLKNEWENDQRHLKEDLKETQQALEVTTYRLEETTDLLGQKSATEAELTEKLELVTDALQTLNDAKIKEENKDRAERARFTKRTSILQRANDELLKLVQTLLDEQSLLSFQLDKEGTQSQSHLVHTEKLLNNMRTREEKALAENKRLREKWRLRLSATSITVATKLKKIMEMASSIDIEISNKTTTTATKTSSSSSSSSPANNTVATTTTNNNNPSLSSPTVSSSKPKGVRSLSEIRALVKAPSTASATASSLSPIILRSGRSSHHPDVRALVRAPSPASVSSPQLLLKPAMKSSSALQGVSPSNNNNNNKSPSPLRARILSQSSPLRQLVKVSSSNNSNNNIYGTTTTTTKSSLSPQRTSSTKAVSSSSSSLPSFHFKPISPRLVPKRVITDSPNRPPSPLRSSPITPDQLFTAKT